MLIGKALCFLATPCLLLAQAVWVQPGHPAPAPACPHPVRYPVYGDLPCPALYTCHNGHQHQCSHPLDGGAQRCRYCNHDADIQYHVNCPHAPHPNRPCPFQ
ncbi:hypothetical protein PGT21_019194 [Puccinia graminis f. sp. tritici]|uniref:C2H2-type domain-containing protein n=1 Tax=Puccinia graminis f. sp. tritici TaxID=56615 RepID=A0A5B0Q395_PUCGR|nr:hypothetical protein PGT21_019194 [Puccinia graminis f. sp. tritici]